MAGVDELDWLKVLDVLRTASWERAMRSVAHELGTPLNVVLGHTELLEEDGAAPGSVGAIGSQARNMTASLQQAVGFVAEDRRPAATFESVTAKVMDATRSELDERSVSLTLEGTGNAGMSKEETFLLLVALARFGARFGDVKIVAEGGKTPRVCMTCPDGDARANSVRQLAEPWFTEGSVDALELAIALWIVRRAHGKTSLQRDAGVLTVECSWAG
ncbi:MAG: hypothetical protein KC776_23300 [Myxococcales bacterium]|nr:hypothetical protein [Myxococcales bacterium]MCB9575485.1 hypothetical protein [Polyangiaceae bacterium]